MRLFAHPDDDQFLILELLAMEVMLCLDDA